MSNKANHLAFRAIFVLLVIIALLILIRETANHMPPLSSLFTFPKPEEPEESEVMPIATPIQFTRKELSRSRAATQPAPPEPEIRRALPVEYTPAPPISPRVVDVQRQLMVNIIPESWSDLVEVPEGFSASFTFSLGRIRVERNGRESGIIYRNPALKAQRRGNTIVGSINPFAMLDRTPRTLCFDRNTRTLRFLSLEKKSEEVVSVFSRSAWRSVVSLKDIG